MLMNDGIYAHTPGFTEAGARQAFQTNTNVRTLAIYCPDPRAYGIPAAVAEEFGEVWPGEMVRDETGAKVAFTTTLASAITVGGRSCDALRTVTSLGHLLNLRNVVVVHHTFCGLSAFTADGLLEGYRHEHGCDLSHEYDRESLSIDDLDRSVRYDVALLRKAPGVHKHMNLYGYVFDINTETLTRIVADPGLPRA